MIVVGAGIVGASVAFHAARCGAAVVLVDRSRPASGVTGDSFAWIGGPAQQPDGSTPLRQAVLDDWARLERDVPGNQGVPDGVAVLGAAGVSDLDNRAI